jgi:hypothetical protein
MAMLLVLAAAAGGHWPRLGQNAPGAIITACF